MDDLMTAVRRILADTDDRAGDAVEEKRMFGGIGFMWRGHLLCSVSARGLLVRVGPEALSDLVRREGVAPMVKGGRTSKGWVHVDPAVVAGTSELAAWIGRAKDVVRNVERP